MSANRRRFLTSEQIDADLDANGEELEEMKNESRSFLEMAGSVIDILALFHLLISGCAIAYLAILSSTTDYERWSLYFADLSQPADFFFYIITFILFLYVFIMAVVLGQVDSRNSMAKVAFIGCAALLGLSLLLGTLSIPMSMMLKRSLDDFGDWIRSPMAINAGKSKIYDVYKPMLVIRMITLIITGPICSFLVTQIRYETWALIYMRL